MELTPRVLAEDSLIFGLRMNAGVNLRELRDRYPAAAWGAIERLAEALSDEGLAVTEEDGGMRLTLRGRLVADAVGAKIMDVMAEGGYVD